MLHRIIAASALLLTAVASAQTTIGSWRLGEDDAAPTNGGAVTTSIAQSGALGNLTASGAVTYSTGTPGIGSTWSISLGSGSPSLALGSNLGVNDNYAIEAWVNPVSAGSVQLIFAHGNTATDGMALLINAGKFDIQVSGLSAVTNAYTMPSATAGAWSHLALVMDNGTPWLYYNGVGYTAVGLTHNNATSAFALGGFNYAGDVDGLRVFTFTSGTFNASMLGYSAVPEPSTYAALAGLAALGLVIWRRRVVARA